MACCDICGAEVSLEAGLAFSTGRLESLAARGFGPPERILARARAAGLTDEQVLERWKHGLAGQGKSTWLLCPECAARAVALEPRPIGTRLAAAVGRIPPSTDASPLRMAVSRPPGPATLYPAEDSAPAALPARRSRVPAALILGGVAAAALLVVGAWYLVPGLRPARPGGASAVTIAPPPTRPTAAPTVTPVPDLSGAALQLKDLPEGFVQFTEQERAEAGLSDADLEVFWGEGLSEGQLLNATAFMNARPGRLEMVVSWLLYPLTPFEQELFDRQASDGTLLELFSSEFGGPAANPAGLLSDMDRFGDRSIGITVSDQDPEHALRINTVFVRRGPVLEVLYIIFEDGRQPPIGLYVLALELDKRVATGLGQ